MYKVGPNVSPRCDLRSSQPEPDVSISVPTDLCKHGSPMWNRFVYEDVTIHDRGFGLNPGVMDCLKSETHQSDPFWLEAAKRYQGGPLSPNTQHGSFCVAMSEYIGH